MNSTLDPEEERALLDAVLRDEDWQTTSAALKAGALAAFTRRQRQRQVARAAGAVVVLACACLAAFQWSGRRAATPPKVASSQVRYLSDEELLALFPKGSCLLAEVDGQKELVFLDPNLERTYLAKPGQPGR